MKVYIVTRRSENNSDVPNLGVFFDRVLAEEHFDCIVDDRKTRDCKICWVNYPKGMKHDTRGTYKEAYIIHKKTKYNKKEYTEDLQIEWWEKNSNEILAELI